MTKTLTEVPEKNQMRTLREESSDVGRTTVPIARGARAYDRDAG